MKTTTFMAGAALLASCVAPFHCHAQTPGGYDNSFALATANGPVFAVGTTSAGYVWMGGYFNSVNGSSHSSENSVATTDLYFDLAVLNTNGGLTTAITFPSYASSLAPEVNSGGGFYYYYVSALAIDSNDVVFAAFNSQHGQYSVIARFDPSGPGSWTFNSAYAAATSNEFNSVYSLAADGSTTYVAGGGSLYELNYSGYNTGYQLPSGIVPYYNSYVNQVRYLPMSAGFTNNSLLICGGFGVARIATTGTSIYQQNVSTTGQPWCAATRTDAQQAACPNPQGELLAGGDGSPFTPSFYEDPPTVDGFFMYRYGPTSTNNIITNTSGENFSISRVDAGPSGDLIVCGDFNEINGASAVGFAHLLPNGSVDPSFYNRTGIEPFDMARQPDGKIVLGGGGAYTDFQLFGDEQGFVERHYGLPVTTNFSAVITTQPLPSFQSVYVGDYVDYYTALSNSAGFTEQWTHNDTNLPGQTSTELYFQTTSTNDSGEYQMAVAPESPCGSVVYSSNTFLEVMPAPAPPPNDDFANAYPISGTNVSVNYGYVRSSTFESGEPDPTGQADGYSVWYTWTAPADCSVTIQSYCDFDAAIGIYSGAAVDELAMITNNCNEVSDGEGGYYCDGLTTSVTFTAAAGTTYQIQVGGAPNAGSLGDVSFLLTATPVVSAPASAQFWQPVYTNSDLFWYSVAAGDGAIVAGGYQKQDPYPQMVASASNPTNWTVQNADIQDIEYVSFSKDRFMIGGQAVILESTDSLTWFSNYLAGLNLSSDVYIEGAASINGTYFAVGGNGVILTSADATTWTLVATNAAYSTDDYLYNVAYGNGLFVAVGDEGSVVTSSDGTNWNLSASFIGQDEEESFYEVAYGNGLFVTAGGEGDVLTSYDGTNWFLQDAPAFYGVTYGAGMFLGCAYSTTVWASPEGTNWFANPTGATADLYDAAYVQNGQFVIVGDGGTILLNQPPSFAPAIQANGGVVLTLPGLNGATAVVETTPSLDPANWQPIYTNTILNNAITYTNNPALPVQFFRALVR